MQCTGYFQHFFFPLVRERVDVYEVRAGFFGYEFRVSPVEFLLDENGADLFFFAKPDEPDELCRGRFLTVGFYGDLRESVVLCKIGERGVVYKECFGVQAVYERVYAVFRGLQVGQCLLQVPVELPGAPL